jgi:pilus assembly protein CpaE
MPAEVRIAIVAPAAETRDVLRAQSQALGLAEVVAETEQYCLGFADRVTRGLLDARPDIVIVDMQDRGAALHSLQLLHNGLPAAWLFVTSAANDSQLIIDAMRAGAREYLVQPFAPRGLAQAVGRYLAARQRHERQREVGRLYCVTAVKGGAGATTVAVNLAAAVTAAPEVRSMLVDLHAPIGDATGFLNLTPNYTLSEALAAAERLDSVLLRSFLAVSEGLAVLSGPRQPWGEAGSDAAALGRVLDVLLEDATHAFADVPATLDREYLRPVVEASTAVLVVLTSELPALWRAQRLLAALESLGAKDKVRLVLNRSRRSDEVSYREIEKTLGHPLFWKLPNNYAAAINAINAGVPVVRAKDTDLGAGLSTLARRLTGLSFGGRRRGLFGGWISLAARTSHA